MKQQLPEFTFERKTVSWHGTLTPSLLSETYTVLIRYHIPQAPSVFVVRPEIERNAKHRFKDDSLCIYDTREREWHDGMFISQSIVPWTSEWLLYYEAWLIDPSHRWFGAEALHGSALKNHRWDHP